MEENQKLILSVVVVVLVAAAIGGGLYWGWKQLEAAQQDLEKKKQEEQELRHQIEVEIPKLKEELDSKRDLVATYEKTLPSAKEIEEMDETLNRYKLQAGVTLESRQPERRRVTGGARAQVLPYDEYSYQLSLEGDFFAWVEFLRLLENHERFIRVDAFDVRVVEGEEEEEEKLEVTTKVSTFSFAKVEPTREATAPPAATPGVER